MDALDIEIPRADAARLSGIQEPERRWTWAQCGHSKVAYQQFSEEEQREIVFKDITTGEVTHTTILDTAGIADYRSVIGYFAQTIMKDLRLVSGYDVLYGKVKAFVQDRTFDRPVDLESAEHAAQPVGTGGDQNHDRNLQESDQRPDRAGQEAMRKSATHIKLRRDAAFCRQGTGLSYPEEERLQPHHRRQRS